MFRKKRLAKQDPKFPSNLRELGLEINDNSQVRQIGTDEPFEFKVSNDKRYNECRREAFQECVRNIIDHRLEALGVQQIKIPLRIADEQPHIPIWVTPDYETNPNLLLLINDRTSDGGMWSMRVIQSEDLNAGSYCDCIEWAIEQDFAIIGLNIAQCVWDDYTKCARTLLSYRTVYDKSASLKHMVDGMHSPEKQVAYIMEHLVKPSKAKKISIIDGSLAILDYLAHFFDEWQLRLCCMIFGQSNHTLSDLSHPGLRSFMAARVVNFYISNKVPGDRDDDPRFGCATLSSGESELVEFVMTRPMPIIFKLIENAQSSTGSLVDPLYNPLDN